MIIKEMTNKDLDEVLKIENDVFCDPWPKKFFYDDLNNDVSKYFVLIDEERIIGYFGLWFMFENADLVNIAIDKDHQGQGLGEKLLRHAICVCINKEVEFLHLEVRPNNLKAKSLYEKFGFEPVRVRRNYYSDGQDCIDMVKGLVGLSEKDFSD